MDRFIWIWPAWDARGKRHKKHGRLAEQHELTKCPDAHQTLNPLRESADPGFVVEGFGV